MTESLTGVRHGFIDLIVVWKVVFLSKIKESYLKHCPALGFVKTLKILFFVYTFFLTGSEQLGAQTLTLENEYLYIEFQQSLPAVDHYVLKSNNQVIYGDIAHYGDIGQYHARIYNDGRQHTIYPAVASITTESDRVCYHLKCELNLQQVVTFDLCYILSGNSVQLSFGNVQEIPDYKLVVVRSPHLLTVRADQGGAKLVFPWAEGRLIDVASTTPGSYYDVGNGCIRAMLMGMLYHQGALAICSYDNLEMILEESVFDDPDQGRVGVIAAHFYYRLPPANYELASFVDVFDEYATSLSAKLTFLTDYDQDGDIDWMDGAKFLRDQVQAIPEPRYLSSWMTKLGRNGTTNITKHLKTIEKLYHLTDHNKIHSYLLNYTPGVFFTLYGYEGDLDPRWASLDELKYVFETAEKSFNTFLGFHDNYLDYYPGTPDYDPALRVVAPDGSFLCRCPLSDYSECYLSDTYEYAVQVGLQRVRDTLSRYPIKESHHIDAFHVVPFRDHSLESPSNREKNRRGINLIIDEFNKYGINVTGECLTGYFVGPGTGWFLNIPRPLEEELPFSGAETIPILEFIYHGKTLYGLPDVQEYAGTRPPDQVDIYAVLEPLLLGASSGAHITWVPEDDLQIDKFYLIDLPWMALNQRFMEDYIVDGSRRKITYGNDTFVEIDYVSKTYTVQVDGRVIGRNYTTFYPKNENTFLIYSREAKTISESLPDDWAENMILLKLTENGINPSVPFDVVDGRIAFQAEANTPYKLMKLNSSMIKLLYPSDNQEFSACSYYDPPTFQWGTGGSFKKIEVQFSLAQNDFLTQPIIKVRGKQDSNTLLMKSYTWKKVLLIPGEGGGTVYWRVVGTKTDKTEVKSDVFSLRIEAPEAIGNLQISHTSKTTLLPPSLTWENNCNKKFKVWFYTDPDFYTNPKKKGVKKKALSYNVINPIDNDGEFSKELTLGQWRAVRKLVGDISDSTIYFHVESWDRINRYSRTGMMSFVLTE